MWSRYEIKNDQVSNNMTINLYMFGSPLKSRIVCSEDDSWVVTEHRHGT